MAYPNDFDDIPTGTPGTALGNPHLTAHGRIASSVRATQVALGLNPPRTLVQLIGDQVGVEARLNTLETRDLADYTSRLTEIEEAVPVLDSQVQTALANLVLLAGRLEALEALA